MDCMVCGTGNRPGRRYCATCGNGLGIVCPCCGFENSTEDRFCGGCGERLDRLNASSASIECGDGWIERVAERRQITVLFCDLVGSTELSDVLDPEDLHEVIQAYQRTCQVETARFGGSIARFLGDALLVYFGYPRAHEDDAERAVRAGLAILQALSDLTARLGRPRGIHFRARIGIATGLVVVGDPNRRGALEEQPVVGETPNLAARLQAQAGPDEILVADKTRRLLGDLFTCTDLGMRPLKGFATGRRIWRILSEQRIEGRFEALRPAGQTPLVGREEEIALLRRRWHSAMEGDGQVVLVSGEPGIGKSRLLRGLRERLPAGSYEWIRFDCHPHRSSSAFHPIVGRLERAVEASAEDGPEVRRQKLFAWLSNNIGQSEDLLWPLSELLSAPPGSEPPGPESDPHSRKEAIFRALLTVTEVLAARRPLLITFEDIHWMDPSTRAYLERLIDRVEMLPALVVATHRTGFEPPGQGHSHVTSLSLNHLTRAERRELVQHLSKGQALPSATVELIVERSDGVPLFLEEVTKSLLEQGSPAAAEEVPVVREGVGGIPATLQDSLMARLDRLGPAKELAQVGAVIGRQFSYGLLGALVPWDRRQLDSRLATLVRSELVFCRGTPPDAIYIFKHALVQDAAYESLLHSRRQALHGLIADAIEQRFPEIAQARPEVLAYHLTQGGLALRAASAWHEAGRQAIGRHATAEAITQMMNAKVALEAVPEEGERQTLEPAIEVTLGSALSASKGNAAPEAEQAYRRACELYHRAGKTRAHQSALYGQFWFHFDRVEMAIAEDVARELVKLAEREDDPTALSFGARAMGMVSFASGNLIAARGHLEHALLHDDVGRRGPDSIAKTADPRVLDYAMYLAWTLFALGLPDQALTRSRHALDEVRRLSHPYALALALCNACYLLQFCRDRAAVRAQAEAVIELSAQCGFPAWLGLGKIFLGWARAEPGAGPEPLALLREGLAAHRATGAALEVPYYLGLLSDAAMAGGDPQEAVQELDNALECVAATGERWFEPELLRLRGEALLLCDGVDADVPWDDFERAMATAGERGCTMWELRAALSMARLLVREDRIEEARALIGPLYARFTEGFQLQELCAAGALLGDPAHTVAAQ